VAGVDVAFAVLTGTDGNGASIGGGLFDVMPVLGSVHTLGPVTGGVFEVTPVLGFVHTAGLAG
jgi:hypothetical protein